MKSPDPASFATQRILYYIDGSTRVIIELESPEVSIPQGYDVRVETIYETLIQALVPVENLCLLSNENGISHIRVPLRPVPGAVEVIEAVNLDENIQAEDLGISDPNILPDNPLYFFKNLSRGVQNLFTFNPIKKAELKEKFTNEKLLEIKKMVEQNKGQDKINQAIDSYQKESETAQRAAEKIKETATENEQLGKFLDKFIRQQVLQQKILQKLEAQVPPQVIEKIKEVRTTHLEKFGEVMTKLENKKEEIQIRLEKGFEEIKGSEFKDFKNLEILKELEEKAPEAAKEAIQKVRENISKKLEAKFEQMPSEQQDKFKLYINEIQGDSQEKIEILENLRSELKEKPGLKEKLLETRDKILNKIENKNCPAFTPPQPDFCKDGRIVIKKSEENCPLTAECLIPGEFNKAKTACVTLWNPVCGKDNRTYSNKCFAETAGIEIAHPGECGSGR